MSVSSISGSSSSSIWWEEYIEKQKKLQEQALQKQELQQQSANVAIAAEKSVGGAESAEPAGTGSSPSGISGGTGASIKWIEALVEGDDEDDAGSALVEALEEYLAELEEAEESESTAATLSAALNPKDILAELEGLQDDPEKLKARAAELAAQVGELAESSGDRRASMFKELASDLEAVASTGDLSTMQAKLERGKPGGPVGAAGTAGAFGKRSESLEGFVFSNIDALVSKLQQIGGSATTDDVEETVDVQQTNYDAAENLKTQLTNQLLDFFSRQYSTLSLTA
ncbi:MAG: hypothetical protein LBQ90_04750 [Synergistaceae bacterium]|nr:hypothetical protein [Synergistaceae bacterium]